MNGLGCVLGAMAWAWLHNRTIRAHVVMRCSACGSRHLSQPMGWQAYAAYAAWGAGAWLIVWRLDPPWLLGWAVTIVLLLGWNAAEAYVRFALWLWWHPARCQGGGVAAPVPEAAS